MAAIGEKLGKDIVTAMKAREQETLTTLRMVKSALKNKEIDKREALTDAEEQSILTTHAEAAAGVGGAVYEGWAAGACGEGAGGDWAD